MKITDEMIDAGIERWEETHVLSSGSVTLTMQPESKIRRVYMEAPSLPNHRIGFTRLPNETTLIFHSYTKDDGTTEVHKLLISDESLPLFFAMMGTAVALSGDDAFFDPDSHEHANQSDQRGEGG